ncbi:dehydrogenase [Citricoccus zhacaiensis]|uniref:Dehydrogenase n=1 Tax=Citricoccus zhacaiensis TaxID=489142 RepID=A0ABQ2M532_9MICC|nr:C-terminal binding protein [Citricoccus zhacaiensis]GGO47285.1 dehydrogenase [Citricoccus zhacaiensis]
MYKIVITDYEFTDLAPERSVFDGQDVMVDAGPFADEATLREACRDADAIINQYVQLDAAFIATLERCRVIARYGIGVNTIDIEAATAAGIMVANVPDGSLDDVSDHAAAMILSLSRGLGIYDRALRRGQWDYAQAKPLHRLRGATLGLLGFGNIPRRLAAKMQVFGMRVIAHDPFVDPDVALRGHDTTLVTPEELFAAADVVSIHLPLTTETVNLVDSRLLGLMKTTALLLNTSRGGIVQEEDLAAALAGGQLGGAGLDVFSAEPLGHQSPFTELENTVLTPHAAWYSEESEQEIRTKTAQNVLDALFQGQPTYLVNRAVVPRAAVGT